MVMSFPGPDAKRVAVACCQLEAKPAKRMHCLDFGLRRLAETRPLESLESATSFGPIHRVNWAPLEIRSRLVALMPLPRSAELSGAALESDNTCQR